MTGRWRVGPSAPRAGPPVARPPRAAGSRRRSGTGRCSPSTSRAVRRLGPDLLAETTTSRDLVPLLRRAEATPPARGGAPGPAARGRDREPVDVRGALAGAALAVAPGRGGERRRAAGGCSRGRATAMRGAVAGAAARRARSTGVPGGRADAAATAILARGQGDDNRTAYWCPVCQPEPGRRATVVGQEIRPRTRTRRGGRPLTPAPRRPPRVRARRVRVPAPRARRGRPSCRSRSRSTSTRDGPALYEYRPLVRGVRRGARTPAARARRRADRARGAPARACRRDLRARARRPAAVRGRGALPDGARRSARSDRRGLRRASTGTTSRSSARTPSSSARSSASGEPTPPSLRWSGISVTTQLELAPGLRMRAVADGELARHWPEAGSLLPKASGARPIGTACSSCARRSRPAEDRPTRRPRWPTRSARSASRPRHRSRPARCSSRRSTGARTASGPCCRSPRRTARRSDAPRRVPRGARRRAARAARARRRRHAPRRGARPLGAVALPARAVPLRAAPRGARRAARRDVAAAGGGPARDGARVAVALHEALVALAARERLQRRRRGCRRRALVETLQHGQIARAPARARRGVCSASRETGAAPPRRLSVAPAAPRPRRYASVRSRRAPDPPDRCHRLRRRPPAARARGAR